MVSETNSVKSGQIGLIGAAAIGIGGMIGAGIFSILGVVGAGAGSAAWISFLGAGLLALICAYSFARLGATFPSSGGPVEFYLRGFGNNLFSGSLNIMLWLGYVLALALYASAFAGYAAALIGGEGNSGAAWLQPMISVGIVGLFLGLNVLGSAAVGKAEGWIVAIKLIILLGFVVITAFYIKPELLSTAHWEPAPAILTSLGTTFLAFEGFGLITNAAGNMKDPAKTLPKALYLSVIVTIVVYVAVAIATFGSLSAGEIVQKQEYALAAAAKPALGQIGFTIMAIAALFSTASAINATLFGGANISVQVAHDRQLPRVLDRKVWQGTHVGLYVTAGLVAVLAATVPLASIANTGSAAFLLLYAGVCGAHLRLREKTNGKRALIWAGLLGCLGMFALLLKHSLRADPTSAIGLAGLIVISVAVEAIYMRVRGPGPTPEDLDHLNPGKDDQQGEQN